MSVRTLWSQRKLLLLNTHWLHILITITLAACGSISSTPTPLNETTSITDTATVRHSDGSTASVLPAGLYFPQQVQPEDGRLFSMEALLVGQLVEVNGCLRVIERNSNTSYMVIWPPNVMLGVEGNVIQILDNSGRVLIQVGDQVRLSGGAIKSASEVESRQPLNKPLPENCSGPYWVTGEEVGLYSE